MDDGSFREAKNKIYEAIRSKTNTANKNHDAYSVLAELFSNSLTAEASAVDISYTDKYFIYKDNGKGLSNILDLFNKKWSKNLDIGFFNEGFTDSMTYLSGTTGNFIILSKQENEEQLLKIDISNIYKKIKEQNKKDGKNPTDNDKLKVECGQYIKYKKKDNDDDDEKELFNTTKNTYFKMIPDKLNNLKNGFLFVADISLDIYNELKELNIKYITSRYNKSFKIILNNIEYFIPENNALKICLGKNNVKK